MDRLLHSAKIYINTDIFPKDTYNPLIVQGSLGSQDQSKDSVSGYHWQNIAVGLCHVQEIDFLVTPRSTDDGRAIASFRNGAIQDDDPATLLLSSPALNFSYGVASSLFPSEQESFIRGMYRNLFNAAVSEGRKYIAMPAAGLGVFGGNPSLYFTQLMEVAKEYPDLNIIYHPAQHGKKFEEILTRSPVTNVVRATKDVCFIAEALTQQGYPCALHNPSDCDVVYGVYDIGEYWKKIESVYCCKVL